VLLKTIIMIFSAKDGAMSEQQRQSGKMPIWRRLGRGLAFAPIGLVPMFLLTPFLGPIGFVIGVVAIIIFFGRGYSGAALLADDANTVAEKTTADRVQAPAMAGQTAPAAVLAPVAAGAAEAYPWSQAKFTQDWGTDGVRMIQKSSPLARTLRTLAAYAFGSVALLSLLLGLWPVTLIAGLIGLACMPRQGIVGAWIGDCPTCRVAVVFADPAMTAALTPLQRLCPLCTAPVEIVRDKFIAIPGTGAPVQPVRATASS
jgi:hypothetical protein